MVSFAAKQLIRDTFPARYVFNDIERIQIKKKKKKERQRERKV